jgi:uncharacterized oligopeptide transporter (OPT) family protein
MADEPVGKPAAMTILEVPGKTPEEIEQYWYKEVYQGDTVPQLTTRSVIMGALLGAVMCVSNLYVGLKTGWALGVVVTASILSYAIYGGLVKLSPAVFGKQMSILENNAMASAASSAGYSTGGTMVSATAAYLLITQSHITPVWLLLWTFFLSALGVFFAIPMKRQMVNIEQLKFPTGTAAAVTLRTLYEGGKAGAAKAWSLALGGIAGTLVAIVRDGVGAVKSIARFALPASWEPHLAIKGLTFTQLTISWENSLILVGAGAITGMRVGVSMLIGGIICWGIIAPEMIVRGVITLEGGSTYKDIVRWTVWPGVAIMVSSSLLQFFMQGKTVLRALKGLGGIFGGGKQRASDDPLARIEVPSSWFGLGLLVMSIGTCLTAYFAFGIPIHHGVIAILMSFILCIVACRATGETDTTPVGALGKITQLTYGVLIPKNMTANLMTASITGNTAATSADLLTDLKAGYLLGANPRKQFLAQFIGCFIGTAVIVPVFYVLVPNAQALGTAQWPAPSAQTWAGVARLLANGLHALHPSARWAMLIGGIVGLVLPLLEIAVPVRVRRWIPSAMSIGLAFVIPFSNALSMFVGALVAWIWEKSNAKAADAYVIPVASGVIAGESIVGVVILLLSLWAA